MKNMEKMICECCGGSIDPRTYRCEYCGTQYKRDVNEQIIRVETFQNPIRTYKSRIVLADEMISRSQNPNEISEFAVKQLAHNLADALAENMEVETEYNPLYRRHIVTARIRVIEPKHIFGGF